MKKRIEVIKIFVLIVGITFLGRAAQMQILHGDFYHRQAESNRLSIRPISAPRGRIYSREGNILVSNQLAFDVYFMPNELGRRMSRDELFLNLAEILELEQEALLNNYFQGREIRTPGEGILLRRNISIEEMIKIQENSRNLPGIVIRESSLRDYVYDDFASHVLGYVGEIGAAELRRNMEEGREYHGGDFVGVSGVESQYENYLRGEKGEQVIEINHRGHKERLLEEKESSSGHDIQLNLELDLQLKVENLLEEALYELRGEAEEEEDMEIPRGISTMIIELDSGAVLSKASYPDYNPNRFSHGLSQEEFRELAKDPYQPLLNRNLQVTVPPGSIFKIITGAAAIENLGISGDTEFYDATGTFNIPGWDRPFTNWLDYGEGELEFTRAMARSNNIVFYELGYEMYQDFGGSQLIETARKFGLGDETGIDLPRENSGRVPDGDWKRENLGEGWYPGDSVNMAIGQGDLLTSPVQMLQMIAAVANRGEVYTPKLLRRIIDSEEGILKDFTPEKSFELDFSDETFEIIEKGLTQAVMEDFGTGSEGFHDFPFDVAGKTGTAQMGGGISHAWFVAYAPVEEPEVALVTFIEEGDTSRNAVPIAAEILENYFEINALEGD